MNLNFLRKSKEYQILSLLLYLKELKRAQENGVDVKGYFHWSLLDNFEWKQGYRQRFGLVYVDFKTGKRYKKDSFEFYKDIISK